MGWTFYTAKEEYKNGRWIVNRKAECDNMMEFSERNPDTGKRTRRSMVLKSAMVGSTYYAAVRFTTFDADENAKIDLVYASVIRTSSNRKDHCNFGYKAMHEDMGPHQCKCPKSILDLLTPTNNEFALAWRENCRRNIEERKNPNTPANLPIGSVIRFKRPDGTDIEICKIAPMYQFKRPFWKVCGEPMYVSANRIPKEYEIVKRGGNA